MQKLIAGRRERAVIFRNGYDASDVALRSEEAENCVHACPKGIPLTESIAEVNRDAWKQALLGWLVG